MLCEADVQTGSAREGGARRTWTWHSTKTRGSTEEILIEAEKSQHAAAPQLQRSTVSTTLKQTTLNASAKDEAFHAILCSMNLHGAYA